MQKVGKLVSRNDDPLTTIEELQTNENVMVISSEYSSEDAELFDTLDGDMDNIQFGDIDDGDFIDKTSNDKPLEVKNEDSNYKNLLNKNADHSYFACPSTPSRTERNNMSLLLSEKKKGRGRPLGSRNKTQFEKESSKVLKKNDVELVATCCLCGNGFIKSSVLTEHVRHCIKTNLSNENMKCKICDKTLSGTPDDCVTHSIAQHQNFLLIPRVNQTSTNL
ncbi:hypothetical protein RF11_14003 [Thelohanellus kitauei]|uniref:C2H2-type domain-containing protein n=1 Tax=Thelohanellus kitauei TaxID=669202 RepID=A0A0C2NJE4_THEKT|nr:hypothetical protein RF11_14003 [Thelohanellus kitauei]